MLFPVKQQVNKCPTEGTPGVKRIVSRECQTSIVYSPDYPVSILQIICNWRTIFSDISIESWQHELKMQSRRRKKCGVVFSIVKNSFQNCLINFFRFSDGLIFFI